MRSPWLKRGVAVLAIAAIAGGFAYALRGQPTLVDVATVSDGPMRLTINEEGVTRVRHVYTVSSIVAGHLTRSVLEEGDSVTANETIVASIHPLDPPLIDKRTEAELLAARDAARSGVSIAEVELQRSEAALKLAEDELARAVRLFKPGIIAEAALQRFDNVVALQRAAVEAAKATIGFRKAELASAEARLMQPDPLDPNAGNCCINLLAPVDGTVLAVFAKSEQAVVPGMKIAEIGDTRGLEIAVDLLSADAVRITPGTKALISDWGGDLPLRATVRRVDPAGFTKVSALGIEEQRVNAVLDLEKPERSLGHGYRVFAEMTIWECRQCLQVPVSALFRNGSEWNVFVVRGDRLHQAELSVGHMNDETAEVLTGIRPGDVVVVHPADVLAEGTLVERRD
jgi:HlyD family secretion protein